MNTNPAPSAPRVVLYAKPGCHLCEEAEAELERLRRRYPHELTVVDITDDAELLARYGLRIPVLGLGGCEYDAPLEAHTIERALAHAIRSQGAGSRNGGV